MLGKLIKNDFKASAHTLAPIYLIALAVGGATALSYVFGASIQVQALGALALLILSFAILIIPTFLVLSYFNKSLYSNQGYLTYTIPAKSKDILFSKALVSFSWIVAGYFMFIGIYYFIYKYIIAQIDPEVIATLEEAWEMLPVLPQKGTIIKVLVTILLVFFFEILVIVSQIFFAMTLSNIKPFNRFGNFGGFVMFAILFVVMFSIFTRLTQDFPLVITFVEKKAVLKTGYTMGETGDLSVIGIAGMVFQFVACVGMFIGTNFLMKKKINIR